MNNSVSVSQLNEYIKSIFDHEEMLYNISVHGEVGSCNISGGYMYFNIKDEGSVLPCVFFGLDYRDVIKSGEQVLLTGRVSYYAKGGKLSFNVTKAVPYGKGLLYQQFIELKNKLEQKGYFASENKKQIPYYSKRIGVVSSETGAVIQDIINVTTRRNNSVDIVLYPVKVQGVGAEIEISKGIDFFSNYDKVDVVIVARGGGSFEDLMPFNTEIVATAAFNCSKPLISAVGHETDFTIIDFVSDLRAPTPSAAAELAVFDKSKEIKLIEQSVKTLFGLMENRHNTLYQNLSSNLLRLSNSYDYYIKSSEQNLKYQFNSLLVNFERNLDCRENQISLCEKSLNNLNPESITKRGFAKISYKGNYLSSVKSLAVDNEVSIEFIDGSVDSKVTAVEEKKWVTKRMQKNLKK